MIGCISLVPYEGKFVAIQNHRGIILPGGKPIPGETFKETAKRELFEETGLKALDQRFIFACQNDEFYVYVFLTGVGKLQLDNYNFSSKEGKVCLASWDDLFTSKFKAYYELLKDVYLNGAY